MLILGIFLAPVAMAQAPTEAELLRQELRELKQAYQERIEAIDERLRRLDSRGVSPAAPPAPPDVPSAGSAEVPAAAMSAKQFADEQFARDTESREHSVLVASEPTRERMEAVLQNFVDITGYFRAGYGRDDQGGPQVGFQAPGSMAKYRLGNEPENYGELTFGKNFYAADLFDLDATTRPDGTPTGPIARFQATVSMYNPYSDLLSSAGTQFALPESWASVGNVVASQPSMKFWAGNRYYRRHDIHINDFFFYNMSGAGGGVEDVQLPFGKFAFAWIGAASQSGVSDLPEPDANNKAGFSKANYDLRLYDVPMPLGKGEFGLVYSRADSGLDVNGNSAPDSDGFALTFLHTRDKFISDDGVNKLSLQYGRGAALTFTSGFETFATPAGVFIRPFDEDAWRFRFTEHFTANVNDSFSIGPALVYQVTDYGQGDKVQWLSAGVRPIVHLNKYVSLAFEGGVDWVDDDAAGTSDSLYKLTFAPQISLGGRFMSRPVTRFFVTYASWGDDFIGRVGGNDYLLESDGLTYGLQMETWW
jgi:maltoporin